MKQNNIVPSGRETFFNEEDIIVSKTDLRGIITYANDVFEHVSGYSQAELIGAPHNILRHPSMPRCVFRLLWDTIKTGEEVFAYVNNMAKNGDNYWVFAHVTPSYDAEGKHVGYHSNRRVPYADALPKVKDLYAALLAEEAKHVSAQAATDAGYRLVAKVLGERGITYSQFVFSLSAHTNLEAAVA